MQYKSLASSVYSSSKYNIISSLLHVQQHCGMILSWTPHKWSWNATINTDNTKCLYNTNIFLYLLPLWQIIDNKKYHDCYILNLIIK